MVVLQFCGITRMTKYNNSLHSFSVNDKVFESLNNEIISNKGSLIPQPIVIIGQQGAGKTTLLKRLYESYPDDKRIWIDGRTIFDSSDIIDNHNISKKNLLFIDDINFYFTRSSYEDQYKLRGFLYNEEAPMMIASMSRIIPAISEYEAPFFEGLKIVYLPPVTENDLSLILDKDIFSRTETLLPLMPPTITSLLTALDLVVRNKNPEEDKERLIDIFSEKYRTLYDSLPLYSQRILNSFGIAEGGMTMPQLKIISGLPTNILSAYLKRLNEIEITSTDKSIKKKSVYFLKDPLFQLWLKNNAPT